MSRLLTVLMAVHNGSPYLRTAIDSILQQTYRDFCFLIVDDASTDDTREIVRSYNDQRIELLCLERNLGQTGALNVGLHQATTTWIARMDADDYSAVTRLQEQMQLLESDHSLSCVGTHAWTFNDDPAVVEGVITKPSDHASIISELLRGSPIIHGSFIINRESLLEIGGYNESYRYANDVELYDRLLEQHRAANVPRPLLGIRRHDEQGSRTKASFDEVIEIFQQRLATKSYTRKESATVRSTLARFHIVRARFLALERSFSMVFKDLWQAFKLSPVDFLWSFFFVLVVYQMSERMRVKIKKLLRRYPQMTGEGVAEDVNPP